jgi:sugar lactone lactonase YvrE
LLDECGPRIVADGLGYTNELAFSPDGRWLYVNETYGQRISRCELRIGPSLGPKR